MVATLVMAQYARVKMDTERPHLNKHSVCIQILGLITEILNIGDEAVTMTDRLERSIIAHHKCMLRCYSHEACKIKSHLQHHIGECFRAHGKNLACFSNERRNKLIKAAASHTSNKEEPSKSVIARLLLDLQSRFESGVTFSPVKLTGAQHDAAYFGLQIVSDGVNVSARVSKSLTWEKGTLRAGEVVCIRLSDGSCVFAHVIGFVATWSVHNPELTHYMIADAFSKTGDILTLSGKSQLFRTSLLEYTALATKRNDGTYQLLPRALDTVTI